MYLHFSNNSVDNTTISCESMGIHYIVTKPARILSLSRWDQGVHAYVKAGQFERSDFAWKHWVRLGQDGQWQRLKYWLHKGDAGIISEYVCAKALASVYVDGFIFPVLSPLRVIMESSTDGKRGTTS
jgi:hypothetical protein